MPILDCINGGNMPEEGYDGKIKLLKTYPTWNGSLTDRRMNLL